MPIIVKQSTNPKKKYSTAIIKPPNITHKMFPIVSIYYLFNMLHCTSLSYK